MDQIGQVDSESKNQSNFLSILYQWCIIVYIDQYSLKNVSKSKVSKTVPQRLTDNSEVYVTPSLRWIPVMALPYLWNHRVDNGMQHLCLPAYFISVALGSKNRVRFAVGKPTLSKALINAV